MRLLVVLSVMFGYNASSQTVFVRECKQKEFHKTVPAGNYSGIAHIEGNKYAVVSDKSPNDGFFCFQYRCRFYFRRVD